MKFALYKYSTNNIGDEIQSIAARRFLPQVDYYIDRDAVGDWINQNKDETVKLIANGWYMHEPAVWPPADSTLKILPISMHVSAIEPAPSVFSSKESISYLKKFDEIGARDTSTKEFFESKGVKSYFSGCLTLTLQKDPDIKRQDYVLAVDVSSRVVEFMRSKTHRPVIELTTMVEWQGEGPEERMAHAERYLYLYQSAHAVVTTRLHTMLPSLAFDTPVLFLMDHGSGLYDPTRYTGLDSLVRKSTTESYLGNYSIFNLDSPGKNPERHKGIRARLESEALNFTGHDNKITWRKQALSKLEMPLVSIIIPVYNVEAYLDDCIKTVLRQTYTNLEIILVNDKSSDESGKKCEEWRKRDPRIKVVHNKKNLGLNMARRVGAESSIGDWVVFIDSDDALHPQAVEILYRSADRLGTDLAIGGYKRFSSYSEVSSTLLARPTVVYEKSKKKLIGWLIGVPPYENIYMQTAWMKLFKRHLIDNIDWDYSNYRANEDEFMAMQYYPKLQNGAVIVPEDLYFYRENPNSITRAKFKNSFQGKALNRFDTVEELYQNSLQVFGDEYKNDITMRFAVQFIIFLERHFRSGDIDDMIIKNFNDYFKPKIDHIDKLKDSIEEPYRTHFLMLKEKGVFGLVHLIIDAQERHISNLEADLKRKNTELMVLNRPGIKLATRKLAGAIKRKLQYLASAGKERIVKK